MPRRQKQEKATMTVVVNSKPVTVILHPPTGARKCWYAYWSGLVASKSTGQRKLEDAMIAAEDMVKNGGKRADLSDAILSDEEFEQIQRIHFNRKQDPVARIRAQKSLISCLNAIAAFREITGLKPITTATPDDCASFQQKALALPKNWRQHYPNGKKDAECLSSNTVLKWSRSLQAAFERANRNALKRKCVRGVIPEEKLLIENPWNRFPWIEGTKRPIRQFDCTELLSFLDYLEANWHGITVAISVAKVCLWSSARRLEVTSLTWPSLRVIGNEYHFEIVGKWGVEKWFRIPEALYRELMQIKTDSPFVFAAYTDQLRIFYENGPLRRTARIVDTEFNPGRLGDWFYERLTAWSKSLPKGPATPHVFRKTSLQYARRGEDLNRKVAADARVSEGVLMTSYVKETDEEYRQASNRTFCRILASLPSEAACRYGHVEATTSQPEERLRAAVAANDWLLVAKLSAELVNLRRPPTG